MLMPPAMHRRPGGVPRVEGRRTHAAAGVERLVVAVAELALFPVVEDRAGFAGAARSGVGRNDAVVDGHGFGSADGRRDPAAAEQRFVNVAVVEDHRALIGVEQAPDVELSGQVDERILLMAQDFVIIGLHAHQVVVGRHPEDVFLVGFVVGVEHVGDRRGERTAVAPADQLLFDGSLLRARVGLGQLRVHDQSQVRGGSVPGVGHHKPFVELGRHDERPLVLVLQVVGGVGDRQQEQVAFRGDRQVDHFVELARRGERNRLRVVVGLTHRPFVGKLLGILPAVFGDADARDVEPCVVHHRQLRGDGFRHFDLHGRDMGGLQRAFVVVARRGKPGPSLPATDIGCVFSWSFVVYLVRIVTSRPFMEPDSWMRFCPGLAAFHSSYQACALARQASM